MTEQTTSQSSEIDELSKEIVKLAVRRSRLLKNAGESGLDLGRLGMDGEEELIRAAIDYSAEIGTDGQEAIRLVRVLMDEAKRLQPKKDLPETPTAIMALAKSLESRGEKLVRLDVGETDFHPPPAAVRAATAAMRSFKTHYTSARGIPELNQAIRGFLGKKYGVEVEAGQIVATPGGRFALYAALISLLRRGGSCVVLDPCWPA